MWPPKLPNTAPSDPESRALIELLEEQQRIVALIEGLRKQRDEERQRLSSKATMLKESLNSLENLNEKGSKLRSDAIPLLDAFSKEVLGLREKRDFLQPLFPNATTLLDGFSTLSYAIDLLKSILEISVGQLFAGVARELYSTEMLCAQTADAITSYSSMTSTAQESIAFKQNGILHPLRRLPEELLVQIFDCCADEEAQEWLESPGSVPRGPKVLTRIAGVCNRWRSVAHSQPRLWRRLLAPSTTDSSCSCCRIEKGTNHFRHAIRLCQGPELDLTIPVRFKSPPDIDINVFELGHLNLLNANETWPPTFPSPKRLWLGQPTTNRALTREIPLSLVSNTSKITSSSISLTFASPTLTVTHLVLCGQHATLPVKTLLLSLPLLVIFDAKDACISNTPGVDPAQPSLHRRLRTFGVHGTGLAFLEQAMVEGLQLPNLRLFEIANIDSEHLATNYPSISTYMSGEFTHLGVFGTGGVDIEALRTFIDAFHRLDTLSLHGAVTEPALQALYRDPSSDGDMVVINSLLLPKAVQRVMICDYQGNGEAIYQQLHEMRADSALNGKDVKIIFQDCLNIRPDIRKKFCSSPVV